MNSGKLAGLAWALSALVLHGCSAPQTRHILAQPDTLPERAAVPDVPFIPQKEYYCGPASLAMMLGWAGIPADQESLADQVYTPGKQGTLPLDVLAAARRNGALAVDVKSLHDLLAEIAAGHPVMVFQNLGLKIWPRWHFAVAVGYDLPREQLVLHSGTDPRRLTNLNAFERTWRRAGYWAVTVTTPDRLPAEADELPVLRAAAGIERAGRFDAARTAYRTISGRWPDSIIARMGLGNVAYKQGDHFEAAAAFREAIGINDTYAPAWHNLANALAAQGLRDEAIAAARQAVELGGEHLKVYRLTLDEISAGIP